MGQFFVFCQNEFKAELYYNLKPSCITIEKFSLAYLSPRPSSSSPSVSFFMLEIDTGNYGKITCFYLGMILNTF